MILFTVDLEAKVRILTFHYNRPDFIEKQYKAFEKFSKEDFELIVFNDAPTLEYERAIQDMCDRYEIQCVRFQQEWHFIDPLNDYIKECLKDITKDHIHLGYFTSETPYEVIMNQPSIRHCHVIQYALDHYGYDHDDIVVIIDGDAFPIRPLSFNALLKKCDIAGIQRIVKRNKVDYFWVIFVAFDPRKLPNLYDLKFHVDLINGKLHDSGSATYHYLKSNPRVKVKKILGQRSTRFRNCSMQQMKANGFSQDEAFLMKNLPSDQRVEFHMNGLIFHYGESSFDRCDHEIKTKHVNKFFEELMSK